MMAHKQRSDCERADSNTMPIWLSSLSELAKAEREFADTYRISTSPKRHRCAIMVSKMTWELRTGAFGTGIRQQSNPGLQKARRIHLAASIQVHKAPS